MAATMRLLPPSKTRRTRRATPPVDAAVDSGAFDCGACEWGCGLDRCSNPIQIRGGGNHTCLLNDEGMVWCWGRNTSGELGDDSRTNHLTPERAEVADIALLATGHSHTCALDRNGDVWCWGNNANGRLGLGDAAPSSVMRPSRVEGVADAVDLSAGLDATCAVTRGGTVVCWGNNRSGQLGLPSSSTPESAVPLEVAGVSAATRTSVCAAHACAIAASEVVCWGSDVEGQLGNGSGDESRGRPPVEVALSEISQISAGSTFTCGIDGAGVGWCWGTGALGDGRAIGSTSPVSVVGAVGRWLQIAAGNFTVVARTGARTWSWGGGLALGADGATSRTSPGPTDDPLVTSSDVTVGSGHACAIAGDGRPMCWGLNGAGALGDGTTDSRSVPAPVQTPER